MMLKGIEFGNVWSASGTEGFFGERYWYHPPLKPFGLDFDGATFVAKTTTLFQREGNMPRKKDLIRPKELFPKSIVVKPFKGVALNAVGLSGPGAYILFEKGFWQKREEPFFISFMSVENTPEKRIEELRRFVEFCRPRLPNFRAPVGLQINYSCPNVGLHLEGLVEEVQQGLDIAGDLGIPLVPKFNVLLPPSVAVRIVEHKSCDAICVSNTIPWGALPEKIDWKGLFGSDTSPLAKFGGGGLSGKPLLPLLLNWIREASFLGIKPNQINAGGGILSVDDAMRVVDCGAGSISLGSIAFLRPWRVRDIISTI